MTPPPLEDDRLVDSQTPLLSLYYTATNTTLPYIVDLLAVKIDSLFWIHSSSHFFSFLCFILRYIMCQCDGRVRYMDKHKSFAYCARTSRNELHYIYEDKTNYISIDRKLPVAWHLCAFPLCFFLMCPNVLYTKLCQQNISSLGFVFERLLRHISGDTFDPVSDP